jgi:hypothetical protein
MAEDYSSEQVFATIAKYCNTEQGGFYSCEGMPGYNAFFEEVFKPAVSNYITIYPDENNKYIMPLRYIDVKPEKREILERITSDDDLRDEFLKILITRMKHPKKLADGLTDLINKEIFTSYARQRQGEPAEGSKTIFYYDDSGNIEDIMSDEEKKQIQLICSLIGSATHGYWRFCNWD